MTQRSLPWDGIVTGDKGPYGAADWQLLYQQVLNDQNAASLRGPIWTDYQDSMQVTEYSPPNMSVDAHPGAALVDGCAYWNTAVVNLAISPSHPTLNRIDRVILRLDNTAQTVRLAVKTGTESASPTPPTLQTDRSPYFEIPLYQVYVAATVTAIENDDLTDERAWVNTSQVPYFVVDSVTNASGAPLAKGDVVVWDNTATKTVTTTTTEDDPQIAGVVVDAIDTDAVGRICTFGVHPVNVAGAVAIGEVLATSDTEKLATNQGANSVGRALTAVAGAGQVTAFINAKAVYPARNVITYEDQTTTLGSSTTWLDIKDPELTITLTTSGGPVEVWGSVQVLNYAAGERSMQVDFTYDGNRYGDAVHSVPVGLVQDDIDSADQETLGFGPVQVNLPPGSHIFKLQWYGNGTNVRLAGIHIFGAREVIH